MNDFMDQSNRLELKLWTGEVVVLDPFWTAWKDATGKTIWIQSADDWHYPMGSVIAYREIPPEEEDAGKGGSPLQTGPV